MMLANFIRLFRELYSNAVIFAAPLPSAVFITYPLKFNNIGNNKQISLAILLCIVYNVYIKGCLIYILTYV